MNTAATDASERSAGIVLAAGRSLRMGEPKQLLSVRGRPMLQAVVDAACASRLDDVVVVLGAHAPVIAGRVLWGRARVVVNADHARGMSSSLRAGLGALGPDVARAVILLGDQPDVDADVVNRLLDAQAGAGLPAAAIERDGLLQAPALLTRPLWEHAQSLDGDDGFRHLIRGRPEVVVPVPAQPPAGRLLDVDTPDDARRVST